LAATEVLGSDAANNTKANCVVVAAHARELSVVKPTAGDSMALPPSSPPNARLSGVPRSLQ
jgi:hypothetical protein